MQQILVYSDSLSWGIVPTTRKRLPFDARWPGVMEIALTEQRHRVRVIEDCLNGRRTVIACEIDCHFFDAGSVTPASAVDGIHLDADQHQRLGRSLAAFVAGLPGFSPSIAR